MNTVKTVFLLSVLTLLLVFAGRLVGGNGGMGMALVLAVVMNVSAYWFSDKIALAMAGARAVSEAEAPELYRIVRDLRPARAPRCRACTSSSSRPRTRSPPAATPSTRSSP